LLFNVTKHAKVNEARIRALLLGGEQLSIIVCDDGIGFDRSPDHAPNGSPTGFGLFGIRERLESLGGTVEVDSAPGRGTRVSLLVPVSSF